MGRSKTFFPALSEWLKTENKEREKFGYKEKEE
jgi:hypothetical protein